MEKCWLVWCRAGRGSVLRTPAGWPGASGLGGLGRLCSLSEVTLAAGVSGQNLVVFHLRLTGFYPLWLFVTDSIKTPTAGTKCLLMPPTSEMAWEEGSKFTCSAPLFSQVSFSVSTSEQARLWLYRFCVDGFLLTWTSGSQAREGEQGRAKYLDKEQFAERAHRQQKSVWSLCREALLGAPLPLHS